MPPGWPSSLPPAGTREFDERVVLWLLDQGPAELRTSPLRTLPEALARVVSHVLAGTLMGIREAYRGARTDLATATSAELDVVQRALEAQAATIIARQREVDLVLAALARSSTGGRRPHRLD